MDFIRYTPRALWVGLAAPFPSDWLSEGHQPGARIMRFVSGAEMAFAYAAYLGVLFAVARRWTSTPAVWATLGAATVVVLIYTVAIPNVGTLYRMRLAAWHVWLGLGCVFLATLWMSRGRSRKIE
jgi:hypothetical protein